MPNLIYSVLIGQEAATWALPLIAAHTAYAVRVGADYRLQTSARLQSGRQPTWEKLTAWHLFARQSYYKKMLWLDADTLPLPALENVFDRSGFWAEVDQGEPEMGERYHRFLARMGDSPMSGHYFNAGVFLVDLETAQRMAPWMVVPPFDDWYHDQDVLNRAIRLAKIEPHRFSDGARYNWMAPQYHEAAQNCKIIHFAGGSKKYVSEFIK